MREETRLIKRDQVAHLARSHMNGSLPFERTIEQSTGTMPIAPDTVVSRRPVELQAYES